MENEPVLHILFDAARKVDDMIGHDETKEYPMFVKPEDMDDFLIGVKTLVDYINEM